MLTALLGATLLLFGAAPSWAAGAISPNQFTRGTSPAMQITFNLKGSIEILSLSFNGRATADPAGKTIGLAINSQSQTGIIASADQSGGVLKLQLASSAGVAGDPVVLSIPAGVVSIGASAPLGSATFQVNEYSSSSSYPVSSTGSENLTVTILQGTPTPPPPPPSPPAATVNLSLGVNTGGLVAGSTTVITATGLAPTAPYEVVLRSEPQTLATGTATSGAVNTTVTMPSGLEAGWHSLTFTSTALGGAAVSSVLYFKISASGTLLETSSSAPPAELAVTGSNSSGIAVLVIVLVLSGAGFLAGALSRNRRVQN